MLLFVMLHEDTNTGVEDQRVGVGDFRGEGLWTVQTSPPLSLPSSAHRRSARPCTYLHLLTASHVRREAQAHHHLVL